MKKLPILFAALLLATGLKSIAQLDIIKTENGSISGTKNGDIYSFKGIPFAAPPMGELRWKAPQPAKNWTGVRKCEAFSASPIQSKPAPFYCWTEEFIAPPEPLSEDCLYLNVWTGAKVPYENRPVFVWIYGGGFSSGSAACAIYDGVEMAKKGVVFVSINYRVGALGFMAHPELSKEQNNASGNYGLLDQIAALKWVQNNIGAFGGDPNNVTIAGQSAGSMSVNCLVASPLAKRLFHRAIAQSGGMLSSRIPTTLAAAEKNGEAFQKKVNAANLAELRKKTPEEILTATQGIRFGVTLDGHVLPTDIYAHFKEGKHNDVPLMAGWVSGDGALGGNTGLTGEKFKQQNQEKYGDQADTFFKMFPAQNDEEAKTSQFRLGMLSFAGMPSYVWAVFNKSKSYLYQFTHVPPDKPNFPNYGAFHTAEVPYALHTLHTWSRPWQETDRQLENTMSDYWVNFAKFGNPNAKGVPDWKSYDKKSGVIMEFGDKVQERPALFKAEFEFLEKTQK